MTLLHLSNVTLAFPGVEKPVLRNIHYKMSQKDFVILLGSNGSGKSTLLKLLHRSYAAKPNEITLNDKCLTQYSWKILSTKIAVLTQNCMESLFASLTVYENFLLIKHRLAKPSQANRNFLRGYLHDYNPHLAAKLDCTITQLSGGEMQVLALAFCLLKPPALLLLDEHTSALDPKTSAQIMALTAEKVAEHGVTCLLTTHDLDIAMTYGNRILMLREGSVYKTFDENEKALLSKEELMHYYF